MGDETMAYDPAEMRDAGSQFDKAADPAERAAARLAAATISGNAFGRFAGAEPFATRLGLVRDEHARATKSVVELTQSLATRSAAAAEMGEQLITDTTAVARRVPILDDTVLRGME